MPRKKKSKLKKENQNQKRRVPQKVYKFLTREEIEANEQKHKDHLVDLRDCINYINKSENFVKQLNRDQLISSKWLKYVNCYPLPKPYKPPDIHSFMEKLKYIENIFKDTTINWLLSVNECSILTQDFDRNDLTRRCLKEKNKDIKFSWEYERDIANSLQVLRSLDLFLDNTDEVAKCEAKKLSEIKEMRNVIMKEIEQFFNRFTYRILCSEEAYMDSIDALTAEYCFQTPNFQMHIWCLKNVPIRLKYIEESHFIANLKGINLTLQIPTFVMQPNFSIRALHLNFDHITENAKSFAADIKEPSEISTADLEDIIECLTTEWMIQTDIQHHVHNEFLEIRKVYEEKLKLMEELKEKEKRKIQSKTNILREPPNVTNDIFPDVREDFLLKEQQQYEHFINATYNPKILELDEDEINLKKFFILGGIYQLYQVEKPKHMDFDKFKFNMTWHYSEWSLMINEKVQIPPIVKYPKRRSLRYKSTTTRNPSLKIEDYTRDLKDPYYILTIKLPEYLCYWGEPIACQYEEVKKIKTDSKTISLQDKLSSTTTKVREQTELPRESISKYPAFLKPQKGNLSDSVLIIKDPSKEDFFRTSLSNIRLISKSDQLQDLPYDQEGVLNIHDYPLSTQLDKPQIRHLQRHLIPRIISSFKFPKELLEDWNVTQAKKKHEGGILIRHHIQTSDENIKVFKPPFTFGFMQNNPERLIPIFPPVEPIRIIKPDNDNVTENIEEPETFLGFIKLLNSIKWQHKVKVRKILDLKAHKSKFPIFNIRVENTKKRKLERKVKEITIAAKFLKIGKIGKRHISKTSESTLQETSSKKGQIDNVEENMVEEDQETYTYCHWTTKHILKSEYNREKRTVIIQTDRLGYFGLAFKQYEHFPFESWTLEPNQEDPENEVIFTVNTQHVRCIISITEEGYKCRVIEPTTRFVSKPKTFLNIEESKSDLKEFMQIFKEKNLNIFADKDASFYMENGYFSEKHLSTELHTYTCMAVYSTHIKFYSSPWNRLAKRRDILLKFLHYQDSEENIVEVRITPEESFFVQTSELCSDNVDLIKLNYELTWRNLSTYSDLHQLINSMYPGSNELKCKNAKLMIFLRNLLCEMRPLSFS